MKLRKLIGKFVSLAAAASIAVSCLPVIGAQAKATEGGKYVFTSQPSGTGWKTITAKKADETTTNLESDGKWHASAQGSYSCEYITSETLEDRNGGKNWLGIKGSKSSSTSNNFYLLLKPYDDADDKIIYFDFDYAIADTTGYVFTDTYVVGKNSYSHAEGLGANKASGVVQADKVYKVTVILDNINKKTYYYCDGELKYTADNTVVADTIGW